MNAPNRFEQELLDVLASDVDDATVGPHPGDRSLRRLWDGRMRVREAERVGSHLAACTACRMRYDQIRRRAEGREDSRAASDGTPSCAVLELWRRLPRSAVLVGFGVLAVVAAVVVSWSWLRSVTVPSLGGVAFSNARGVTAGNTDAGAASSALSPQTLVRALRGLAEYPAHRAAAYAIGLLRRHGVALTAPALAFDASTIIVAEPGDSWETIAAKSLGDRGLWPIVIMLNLEHTQDGEFVPPGTYLRVPTTLVRQGST